MKAHTGGVKVPVLACVPGLLAAVAVAIAGAALAAVRGELPKTPFGMLTHLPFGVAALSSDVSHQV